MERCFDWPTLMTCSACFLYNPGPPAQWGHPHQSLIKWMTYSQILWTHSLNRGSLLSPSYSFWVEKIEDKWFFSLSKQVSMANVSWLIVGLYSYLPLLCSGILLGLKLWKSCEYYHRLCEFILLSVLLCLNDIDSLESSTTSDSYSLYALSSTKIPEPWWEKGW